MDFISTLDAAALVYPARSKALNALNTSPHENPSADTVVTRRYRHALLRDTNTELRRLGVEPDALRDATGQLRWDPEQVRSALARRPGRGNKSQAA